ncbi:hypothetical protein TRICI_003415 [Trichomonascus ciferrii]|uniref:Uncharacterized protein n=1 Tax=Trichomonascus ciferrii TaxID=44093 RepID=A0A642V3U7_9ASCO|nr:hypothetical protein TRICI_003415 [Trichomonascus ciferrii]
MFKIKEITLNKVASTSTISKVKFVIDEVDSLRKALSVGAPFGYLASGDADYSVKELEILIHSANDPAWNAKSSEEKELYDRMVAIMRKCRVPSSWNFMGGAPQISDSDQIIHYQACQLRSELAENAKNFENHLSEYIDLVAKPEELSEGCLRVLNRFKDIVAHNYMLEDLTINYEALPILKRLDQTVRKLRIPMEPSKCLEEPELFIQANMCLTSHLSKLKGVGSQEFMAPMVREADTGTGQPYVPIDTTILCKKILHRPIPGPLTQEETENLWSAAFNFDHPMFHDNEGLQFNGTIITNGISVLICFGDTNIAAETIKRAY